MGFEELFEQLLEMKRIAAAGVDNNLAGLVTGDGIQDMLRRQIFMMRRF